MQGATARTDASHNCANGCKSQLREPMQVTTARTDASHNCATLLIANPMPANSLLAQKILFIEVAVFVGVSTGSSEMSVNVYQTTRRHIPEHNHFSTHSHRNIISGDI
jgi:hypothetical protein